MTIAWRQWKLGAGVSLAMALFVALSGLAAGMNWRAFLAVLGSACATHFGAFLIQHPADAVDFGPPSGGATGPSAQK